MDLLSRLLLSLKIESSSISNWDMRAPWGVDVIDFSPGYCLTVVEGRCWVQFAEEEPVALWPRDILMVPKGGRCQLVSSPGTPCTKIADLDWVDNYDSLPVGDTNLPLASSVAHGGSGPACQLLGLAFAFQPGQGQFILSALPYYTVLRSEDTGLLSLAQPAIDFLLREKKPGDYAVSGHMAELIILDLLRTYFLRDDHSGSGWLMGLQDKHIARALKAMHEKPEHRWTLAELAGIACLSRSAFAATFTRLIGQSPIEYLNDYRIGLAIDRLRDSRAPIAEIAASLGYQSDRVFRQNFKTRTGLSPQKYRRR